jgi:hypothetical protein
MGLGPVHNGGWDGRGLDNENRSSQITGPSRSVVRCLVLLLDRSFLPKDTAR